ncbi:MAG: GGDEF domain-containing protein [Gemmatimonadota bacterium]|nr:GGDEF domain-containing protein [Gemmatimonadota bacterium]
MQPNPIPDTRAAPWRFGRLHPVRGIVLAVAGVASLGVLDYLTGYELSFAVFYLLPVTFAAWFSGRASGVVTSLASASVWQFSNYVAGETFSRVWIPYWNASTRLAFFLIVTLLVTRLGKTLVEARAMARTDFLTGTLNSRAFHQLADAELTRQRRYRRPLTLVYVDLDNFKTVNDSLGHSAGDALLRAVAATIATSLRATDALARLGGDEFLVLLPETDAPAARTLVDRLQTILTERVRQGDWPVTVSMGVVTCPQAPASVDALIQLADSQMYVAKQRGKNRIASTIVTPPSDGPA